MKINRVFNKLKEYYLVLLSLSAPYFFRKNLPKNNFKAPQEKAGFITLQGQQGDLTVPIGKYTDHSVKNARIDSRELDLALFR